MNRQSEKEFATLINSTDVIVVDVRTAEEHNQGHIPGTDFKIKKEKLSMSYHLTGKRRSID